MKAEIKDLRRRIDDDRKALDKLNKTIVRDSVACGKKGKKPIRTVKVEGLPSRAIMTRQKLYESRIHRLEMLESKLLEMTMQAEEYIESIPKSELRIMFRYYFIDGLSYPKVADRMNSMFPKRKIAYTDENVKKRIQRYFENVPQCPEKI